MKRAAVQWGIGRILYDMDVVFVDVEQRGKSWVIKKNQRAKMDKAYTDLLKALHLEAAPPGSVQSLLKDNSPEDAPQPVKTPTPTAIPSRDIPPEKTPEPAYAYMVTDMKIQKGISSTNTQVKIKNTEGREVIAFVQGEHPELKPGTLLSEVRLLTRQQDTVVYYILASYQLAEQPPQAA